MEENRITKSLRQFAQGSFRGASVLVLVTGVLLVASLVLCLPMILVWSLILLGFPVKFGIGSYVGALMMMAFLNISTHHRKSKKKIEN
jgi:hypothetical protein